MQTQTKPTFTPGPWRFAFDTERLYGGNGAYIAEVHGRRHVDTQIANARLIAKAPELYAAALVSVRDQGYTSDPAGALNRIKDAAAKLLAEIEGA